MATEKTSNKMDRPLKIWEFFAGIFGLLLIVGTMIYNRGTIDAHNQSDIEILKSQVLEIKSNMKDQNAAMNGKMDNISNQVNNILVILQNKEDRK